MSKLSPKPDSARPLLSWQDLDKRLQANLTKGNPDERYLVINPADFEMTVDEIEAEATNQGYIVSKTQSGYMRFE